MTISPSHSFSKDAKTFLIEETNRCVSCGLCLPHCPTYRLLKSEADSPRGRLAMMNGVANSRIPINEKFLLHLDRCLMCRACEAVCPNHVSYGRVLDETKHMIHASNMRLHAEGETTFRQNLLQWLLSRLAVRPVWFDHLHRLLYYFKKGGFWPVLYRLLRRSLKSHYGIRGLLEQLQPVVLANASSWRTYYSAAKAQRGVVGLFLGCVARLTDAVTLNDSIYVLNRLGYGVHVSKMQTCCGALHQHAGDAESAAKLKKRNFQAFVKPDFQVLINTASGCGAQLSEYEQSVAEKSLSGEKPAVFPEVMDISKFLVTVYEREQFDVAPLAKRVAVHDPCSLRHVLCDHNYPHQLVQKIPGAQLVFLADNDQCCGAAGTYFIRQSELAGKLLDHKINAIMQSNAQILVTSNVGCAMHIAGRLREMNSEIEVMHPVTLLANQMRQVDRCN